jgi:hypothetical protein
MGDHALSRIKRALLHVDELAVRIYVSAAAQGRIRDNHAVTDDGAISIRRPPAVTTP